MSDAGCLKVCEEGRVTTVQFRDDYLVDQGCVAEVQRALNALIADKDRPLMLIDFYDTKAISSALLGTLIALHKQIKVKKGRMRLTNVQPPLMRIFTLTNLDKVIGICSTRTLARSMLTGIAWDGAKP